MWTGQILFICDDDVVLLVQSCDTRENDIYAYNIYEYLHLWIYFQVRIVLCTSVYLSLKLAGIFVIDDDNNLYIYVYISLEIFLIFYLIIIMIYHTEGATYEWRINEHQRHRRYVLCDERLRCVIDRSVLSHLELKQHNQHTHTRTCTHSNIYVYMYIG